jgi:catechol 2,3-dioxygenase-like lactoylglutathione lyase family enzyme
MRIGLTGIFVDDQDRAERFCTEVLGFKVKTSAGTVARSDPRATPPLRLRSPQLMSRRLVLVEASPRSRRDGWLSRG